MGGENSTRRAGALRKVSSGSNFVSVQLLGQQGELLIVVRKVTLCSEMPGQGLGSN